MRRLAPIVTALALAACDSSTSSGTLSVQPTAIGTAASGSYELESLTTSCGGTCAINADGFTVSVCDIGSRVTTSATVTETDGHLVVDTPDSDYASRLEGNVDATGAFEVTGTRTQEGAQIYFRADVLGAFTDVSDPTTTVAGTVTVRVTGSVEGHSLSCTIVADLNGGRTQR